jgi:hypothetical protein
LGFSLKLPHTAIGHTACVEQIYFIGHALKIRNKYRNPTCGQADGAGQCYLFYRMLSEHKDYWERVSNPYRATSLKSG